MHTKTWSVEIFISDHDDGTTGAEAVLHTTNGNVLRHHATARRNSGDRDVPEIGEELATCRALTGLAQDLFEATIIDIEDNTGREAGITG
jgi:hypothetical protein